MESLSTTTFQQLRAACHVAGLSRSGTKAEMTAKLVRLLETAPLEKVRELAEGTTIAKLILHVYRPMEVQQLVDIVGLDSEVRVPVHNGRCTDVIEKITTPQRGAGGTALNPDYCISSALHRAKRNVTADMEYEVGLHWLLSAAEKKSS